MYWLYGSQIFMIPIYSICIFVLIAYLDQGQTIATDTFYAHMDFSTSHRLTPFVWDIIGLLLACASYLYYILVTHTAASGVIDAYRCAKERITRKEVDEL
jgi:uncharacterized membrane protein